MKFALLDRIEAVRPFTENEAWGLFRLAAFGEAIGWSLLISGILAARYKLPGHAYILPMAGQVHGLLFLFYFGILLAVYSSLRWPRGRSVVAALAGVVPFGTLVFEQWVVHADRRAGSRVFLYSMAAAMASEDMAPGQ